MTVPNCPKHDVPMRPSQKGGGFYCPKKDGDDWCKEKVAAPKAETPSNGAPAAIDSDALAAAALNFAATLYRGAGGELGDDAIALAIKAYSALRAVAS